MKRRAAIIRRLDAALDKMEAQQMAVRRIYLTDADWAEYDAAQSKAWGSPVFCFQYDGHPIHGGRRSIIYSTHGVGVAIPKRAPAP